MKNSFGRLAFLSCLLGSTYAQVVTVSIGVCPSTYGTPTSSPGNDSLISPTATGDVSTNTIESTPTPSVLPYRFLISYRPADAPTKRRKRAPDIAFISYAGDSTLDYHTAAIYSVSDAYILSAGSYGIISTDLSTPFQIFAPSTTIRTNYAIWKLDENGNLAWENSYFLNGKAGFCVYEATGKIRIYFKEAPPSDCSLIVLKAVDVAEFPDLATPSTSPSSLTTSSLSPNATAPTGWTGLPGSAGVTSATGAEPALFSLPVR